MSGLGDVTGGTNNGGGDNSGGGAGNAGTADANGAGNSGGAANSGAGASGGGASGGAKSATDGTTNLGDGGKGAGTSWRDSLPDDLKADPTLSKYSDLSNLAKAHVELQKKFGQKGVFKPGKDASPEEIKSFREAMGIPTDPTKYDMGQFEGVKVDPAIITWAQKVGTENGIDPAALKNIITDYFKIDAQNEVTRKSATETEMKKGLDGLKTEWGDAFDRNLQRANFAAEKIGGKPLIDALVKAGVHNNPVILKAFENAAKLYSEDKLREGGINDSRVTPGEIDAKIQAVQSRLFAMKPSDGAYSGLKLEYESLWKQKTGGR